jgi:hypothetical protein
MIAEIASGVIAGGALLTAMGTLGKLAVQTFAPDLRERRRTRVRDRWAASYQIPVLARTTTSHRRVMTTAPGMAAW